MFFEEKRHDSQLAIGGCCCTRLFQMEKSLMELLPEERHNKRLELEKTVRNDLLAWVNESSARTVSKSVRGKRLHDLTTWIPIATWFGSCITNLGWSRRMGLGQNLFFW